MGIFLNIILLIIGFVGLVKGADFFVDGSSALAQIFKVPAVIIGLTIVALGTSMHELAVSTTAAINGSNEIALINVVGSNLFNLQKPFYQNGNNNSKNEQRNTSTLSFSKIEKLFHPNYSKKAVMYRKVINKVVKLLETVLKLLRVCLSRK